MLLAIDIGNTNTKFGLYQSGELGPRWRIATNLEQTTGEYGLKFISLLSRAKFDPQNLIGISMASVVPTLTPKIVEACQHYLGKDPLVVEVGIKTGVRILYDDPKAVGADRIVNCVAVQRLYGGPACVVDVGTATKFEAISDEGDYLGGAIAPGIGIAGEALFTHAAKLAQAHLTRPPSVIGRNNTNAIQSGLLFGYVGLVEGMVARFREELGPEMKVVTTGGLAEVVAKETDVLEIIAPWLTLDGLRIIWSLNQ
jgi:type III pantothenate kinase